MSITQQLQAILQARYGRDVRQAIHDSIEDGYNIAVQAEGKATTAQDSASASASAAAQSSTIALQSAQLAEQYKNEAFSGTPTGYEDLVNKVKSIYRETASDFAIIGTSEGSALAHTIYGMSVQDGTPTPSVPVEIKSAKADFRCVGKNLIPYPYHSSQSLDTGVVFNGVTIKADSLNKNRISFVGTSTGRVDARIIYPYYDNYLSSENYKIKIKHISGTNRHVNLALEKGIKGSQTYVSNKARATLDSSASEASTTFTVTDDEIKNYSFSLVIYGDPNQTYDDVYEVSLTLENADQTDEPYQHIDITTDLTLRAIEVTSSDDFNLEKDGKYYIADTVDWSEDDGYVLTRRIGKRDITTIRSIGSLPRYGIVERTSFNYEDFVVPSNDSKPPLLACNRFIVDRFYNYQNNDGIIAFNTDNKYLYLRNDTIESLADWNTWITNNHVEVYGVLKTPTTEPITSEQAQALLSLKTYDEATSITAESDIEPTMMLEYSKDRNTALALTGHNVAFKNALKTKELNTALLEVMAEQEA